MNKLLKTFKTIAVLEGISFLAIFITMYFKYQHEIGLPNKIVGYIHGVLFMLYIFYAFKVWKSEKWSLQTLAIVLLASIIPFGTFYVDKKYLKAN